MAKLEFRLSSKIQKDSGRSEILVTLMHHHARLRAKSEIFIDPSFFEHDIDWKRTIDAAKAEGRTIRQTNDNTATERKAKRNGYILRDTGRLEVRQTLQSKEVIFHKEQRDRLNRLKDEIISKYESANKSDIDADWLRDVVERYNHPEKYRNSSEPEKRTIYDVIDEYVKTPDRKTNQPLVESHARVFYVLSRAIARYSGFVRETDKGRKDFNFDIDKVTKNDIEDFADYLRNEKKLSEDMPTIFEKLLSEYPQCVKKGRNVVEGRGENTIIKMKIRLKSVFRYCNMKGYTNNKPFEGITIGTAKVGTPYYISIDERNTIAEADLATIWETLGKDDKKAARMPIKTLIAQRDIFIFQCLIGCRVGDLLNMTEELIHDGILVYTPHKTKDEGVESVQARVPLHPKALSLIEQYRGQDPKGRLFPFITAQKYNYAIKAIFKMSGITRKVEVRNPRSGENELIPLNEIASSHLARRTFVGNAYFKVHDPNLIGKMSGHVEGSKAFSRYRNIEDETLKEVINLLG